MASLPQKTVANIGCGPPGSGHKLPEYFAGWRELRVDIDPKVMPDVIAELTDLSPIATSSVDAIWAAHCVEHLFLYQVANALGEFHRILSADGIACILVPDLQTIAKYIAEDKLHDKLYDSASGPITPHDIVFGHGDAIAEGRTYMAHKCGFTPSMLVSQFSTTPFAEFVVVRRPNLELATVAVKKRFSDDEERRTLLKALGL